MLAVLANTDGRADALAATLEVLSAGGAEYLIHCGDVGGRHVLDAMKSVGGGFVWGDRDWDRMGLMRYAQSIGVDCFGVMGELEYEGKRIVVVHGDDNKLLNRLIREQQYDFVFHGHAMTAEDRTVGRTRVINPGPFHGGQGRSTVLLDPVEGRLKLLAL